MQAEDLMHRALMMYRNIGTLCDKDALLRELLTREGPRFDIGEQIIISSAAWRQINGIHIVAALKLHECSIYGNVNFAEDMRNEEAIDQGGRIESHWNPDSGPFRIMTNTKVRTEVDLIPKA